MPERPAIYLDANAGTPLGKSSPEALLALLGESGPLGNPSSRHQFGRQALRRLVQAQESVARSLGEAVRPEELIFTSSGTEANQTVIRGELEPRLLAGKPTHWICSAVEHDSVLEMAEWVRCRGGRVDMLPVDTEGRPDLRRLADLWRPGATALLSLIWVNNETGVISDVAQASRLVRGLGGRLHLDGAQAWGKLSLGLTAGLADFASFSAHKIGGLAGTGILWAADPRRLDPLLPGKQQGGRRGGTENLLGILAAGIAAGRLDPETFTRHTGQLRERLESRIQATIKNVQINGGGAPRVANTVNLSFTGVSGESLVTALDLAGFAVSAGSACASGSPEPSHVLLAMGQTIEEARAGLRISFGPEVCWEDLEAFAVALKRCVTRLRGGEARQSDSETTAIRS